MARDFTLEIARFLGLNLSCESEESLQPGESPEMVNFQVTPEHDLKRREGFSSVFLSSGVMRGIYYATLGEERRFLAVVGNSLYHSASGFDSLSPVEGNIPGEGKVTFFLFYGKIYLFLFNFTKFTSNRVDFIHLFFHNRTENIV